MVWDAGTHSIKPNSVEKGGKGHWPVLQTIFLFIYGFMIRVDRIRGYLPNL